MVKGVTLQGLAYNTPINSLGTKAAVYAYKGNVRVGEQLAVLDIKGDNSGYGLVYSMILLRILSIFFKLNRGLNPMI